MTGDPPADLPVALERLAATALHRDGTAVRLRVAPELPPLPPATAGHLARIAAEAVHNSAKHAGTDEVRVELEVRGSELVLTVADEGCGFEPGAPTGDGHGQRTMRERAVLCGAGSTSTPRPAAAPASWHGSRCRADRYHACSPLSILRSGQDPGRLPVPSRTPLGQAGVRHDGRRREARPWER